MQDKLGARRRTVPFFNASLWLVPAVVALVAFARATSNGFVWDDPLVLAQLREIRSLSDLVLVPAAIPQNYYRPVVFVSFLVDQGLGGGTPFWFHASVVGWHVLATVLVFFVAQRVLGRGRELFAGIAALLFAVHPVHVESVAWIAGRSDVIACVFLLASLLAYLRADAPTAAVSAVMLLLSLLAKETAVIAVAAYPLADRAVGRSVQWQRLGPLAAVVPLYALLRYAGVGSGDPIEAGWAPPLTLLYAFGFYVGKAFLPLSQTVYASSVPQTPAYLLIGAIALVAAICAALWAWRREQGALLFAVGWFLLTLAPSSLLVLRRIATTPVAERYAYVPTVGAVLLLAYVLAAVAERTRRERAVAVLAGVLAVAGLVETMRRNEAWTDDLRFWTAAVESSPTSLPLRELGDAYLRRERLDEAEAAYERALVLADRPEDRAMAYVNVGNLYRRRGRVDEAVQAFEKAAAIGPHPLVYHNWGFALMKQAELAQAQGDQRGVMDAVVGAGRAFERAIALGTDPNAPPAFRSWEPAKTHLLLGQVLFSLGKRDEAKRQLEEALRLEPAGLVGDTARTFLQRIQG